MSEQLHFVPSDAQAIIEMAFMMRQKFLEGMDEPDEPGIARLCDDPEALLESALDHCRLVMQRTGKFMPRMFFFSRNRMNALLMPGGVPDDLRRQAELTAPLKVMIASAPVGAYWFGSETWVSRQRVDSPPQRPSRDPNRAEGLLIITASRARFRMTACETLRLDNVVTDLGPPEDVTGFVVTGNPLCRDLFAENEALAELRRSQEGNGHA